MTAVQSLPNRVRSDVRVRRSSGDDHWAGRRAVGTHPRRAAAIPSVAGVLPIVGTHARRAAVAPSLTGVLPSPPDVQEKYCYIRRHLWVLVSCSVVSFGCLTFVSVEARAVDAGDVAFSAPSAVHDPLLLNFAPSERF